MRRPGLLATALAAGLLLAPQALRAGPPLRQVIDAEVKAALEREKVAPAGPADDAAFLRRIHLDLAGTLPTHDEVKRFLEDRDPDKRAKWIDKLLADPRFALHQADVWDQVLFGRNPPNGDISRDRKVFKQWLADQFAGNVPYDRW